MGSSVTITDLDQDGDVDLLVGAIAGFGGPSSGRVFAFDLDAPYNPNTMEWPTRAHDARNTGRWEPLPCPDHDVDFDSLCAPDDNCPSVANLDQLDTDRDGVGDACDRCPSLPNPGQDEPVACLALGPEGGQCTGVSVELAGSESGEILLFGRDPVGLESITFEPLATSCGSAEELQFALNGQPLGALRLDPGLNCACRPYPWTLEVSDPALLSSWNVGGGNVLELSKDGTGSAIAWVRARLRGPAAEETACLYDFGGGSCDLDDLCAAGFSYNPLRHTASVVEPLLGEVLRSATPYTGSTLPALLDLAGIPDGPLELCVTDGAPSDPAVDCIAFPKAGEEALALNGTSCAPTAEAGLDLQVECTSPAGATVVLDGTASADVNSTPGTNDDIVLFEWFDGFGTASQALLGTGAVLSAELNLGRHEVTLRVSDSFGATGLDRLAVEVRDTTPPELAVELAPSVLWPPDHRMVEVTALTTAFDRCGEAVVALESATSDEPDDAPGGGDGHTVGDIRANRQGESPGLQLRAERAGSGDGRTYTLLYRATDAAGNQATAAGTVVVPHDREPD